jgi:BTB/POZ domain
MSTRLGSSRRWVVLRCCNTGLFIPSVLFQSCVSYLAANKSAFKTSELEDLLEKKLKLAVGLLIRVLFHGSNDESLDLYSTSPFSTTHEKLFPVPDAVAALLRYYYGGDMTRMMRDETVAAVFKLADEYRVDELKSAMKERLVENISTANVVENEMAATVFQLAEKHDMDELKSAMEKRLVENLSIDNVVEMAALADAHSAQDLRKVVCE